MSCTKDEETISNASQSGNDEYSESEDSIENDVESSDNSEEFKSSRLESESEPDSERTDIRGELKNMSFEELMKLKQSLGSKVYNEAIFGATNKIRNVKKNFKRLNANRPKEISSKRQVPFGTSTKKKQEEVIADPRFNANCGDFDSTKFKKQYDFVNNIRETELKELKENLRKCNDPEETLQIKYLIQRLKNQLHDEKIRKEKLALLSNQNEMNHKGKEDNKKPFYIKPNLKKTEELVKQFEDLKKSGKLQKHLEKRRKKSIIKDRKKFNVQ